MASETCDEIFEMECEVTLKKIVRLKSRLVTYMLSNSRGRNTALDVGRDGKLLPLVVV